MGIQIATERDRVLLALPVRTKHLAFTPDQAVGAAAEIDRQADFAAAWERSGGHPDPHPVYRGADIVASDGRVYVRLDTPTTRESIPHAAARRLAAQLRAKARMAMEDVVTGGQR